MSDSLVLEGQSCWYTLFFKQKLGSGAISEVYKGERYQGSLPVAIKVIKDTKLSDQKANLYIDKEYQVTKLIKERQDADEKQSSLNENVLRVLDVLDSSSLLNRNQERQSSPQGGAQYSIKQSSQRSYSYSNYQKNKDKYIITEICNKETLYEYMSHKSFSFDQNEVLDIAIQIANGLNFLHKNGWMHRDLKPENIFVHQKTDQQNQSTRLIFKIGDFGLIKNYRNENRNNTMVGTINYMSPEVIKKQPYSCEIDFWSLGCIIHELQSGQQKFWDTTVEGVVQKIMQFSGVHINQLGNMSLERIIFKCLNLLPQTRYKNAQEIIEDLEQVRNQRYQNPTQEINQQSQGIVSNNNQEIYEQNQNYWNNIQNIQESFILVDYPGVNENLKHIVNYSSRSSLTSSKNSPNQKKNEQQIFNSGRIEDSGDLSQSYQEFQNKKNLKKQQQQPKVNKEQNNILSIKKVISQNSEEQQFSNSQDIKTSSNEGKSIRISRYLEQQQQNAQKNSTVEDNASAIVLPGYNQITPQEPLYYAPKEQFQRENIKVVNYPQSSQQVKQMTQTQPITQEKFIFYKSLEKSKMAVQNKFQEQQEVKQLNIDNQTGGQSQQNQYQKNSELKSQSGKIYQKENSKIEENIPQEPQTEMRRSRKNDNINNTSANDSSIFSIVCADNKQIRGTSLSSNSKYYQKQKQSLERQSFQNQPKAVKYSQKPQEYYLIQNQINSHQFNDNEKNTFKNINSSNYTNQRQQQTNSQKIQERFNKQNNK